MAVAFLPTPPHALGSIFCRAPAPYQGVPREFGGGGGVGPCDSQWHPVPSPRGNRPPRGPGGMTGSGGGTPVGQPQFGNGFGVPESGTGDRASHPPGAGDPLSQRSQRRQWPREKLPKVSVGFCSHPALIYGNPNILPSERGCTHVCSTLPPRRAPRAPLTTTRPRPPRRSDGVPYTVPTPCGEPRNMARGRLPSPPR